MRFSKCLFFAVAAVLVVFANQAQGNISAALGESAQAEKLVNDQKFQDVQEAIIMEGTDGESFAARAFIQDIRNMANMSKAMVDSPVATNAAIEGVLAAIRDINLVMRQANLGIDAALEQVKAKNIDGAVQAFKKGIKTDREIVFLAGVPVHDAQGQVLAIVGGAAFPALQKCTNSIQKAGGTAFEVLQICDGLGSAGIETGGPAAEKALKSARDVLSTGSLAIYAHLRQAAAFSLEGIHDAISNKQLFEIDLVPGIIESLKTPASKDNAAALDFISKLSKDFQSASSVLTKKPSIDAANVLYEGLRSTMEESIKAMSVAKKFFGEAAKLAFQDSEAAIGHVRKGIASAKDILLNGSAFGYLALGACGQIAGKEATKALVPDVIEIEYGRVAAYETLELAERTAIVGIRGGDLASVQGIYAAIELCDDAGVILYQDYAEAGENGFEALKKL